MRLLPPPGEDGGSGKPIPQIPPMRKFIVHREDPHFYAGEVGSLVEELVIESHTVELTGDGTIILFRQYMIHPIEGPTNRVVRCLNGFIDYEEIIAEAVEVTPPSNLLLPFGNTGSIQ